MQIDCKKTNRLCGRSLVRQRIQRGECDRFADHQRGLVRRASKALRTGTASPMMGADRYYLRDVNRHPSPTRPAPISVVVSSLGAGLCTERLPASEIGVIRSGLARRRWPNLDQTHGQCARRQELRFHLRLKRTEVAQPGAAPFRKFAFGRQGKIEAGLNIRAIPLRIVACLPAGPCQERARRDANHLTPSRLHRLSPPTNRSVGADAIEPYHRFMAPLRAITTPCDRTPDQQMNADAYCPIGQYVRARTRRNLSGGTAWRALRALLPATEFA